MLGFLDALRSFRVVEAMTGRLSETGMVGLRRQLLWRMEGLSLGGTYSVVPPTLVLPQAQALRIQYAKPTAHTCYHAACPGAAGLNDN